MFPIALTLLYVCILYTYYCTYHGFGQGTYVAKTLNLRDVPTTWRPSIRPKVPQGFFHLKHRVISQKMMRIVWKRPNWSTWKSEGKQNKAGIIYCLFLCTYAHISYWDVLPASKSMITSLSGTKQLSPFWIASISSLNYNIMNKSNNLHTNKHKQYLVDLMEVGMILKNMIYIYIYIYYIYMYYISLLTSGFQKSSNLSLLPFPFSSSMVNFQIQKPSFYPPKNKWE